MTFPLEIKRHIFERSNGLCEVRLQNGERCMAPAVDTHHIIAKGIGGRRGKMKELINDGRNGMAVCRQCHDNVNLLGDDFDLFVPGREFRELLRREKGG